jgi:IS5 family transposase
VRRVTRPIRREMKRRAAVEPVIGHLKAERRMAAIISKAGKEIAPTPFRLAPPTTSAILLRWLSRLLRCERDWDRIDLHSSTGTQHAISTIA